MSQDTFITELNEELALYNYDYRKAVKNDVIRYIKHNLDEIDDFIDIDDYREHLNEVLWLEDSVTGNASGSYTFSRWKAECHLCHNLDLIEDAFNEFDIDITELGNGAEFIDSTIRCYLLPQAIEESLEELSMEIESKFYNK